MSRGSVFQALQKLSGDWSAPEYARLLTKELLTELLPSFDIMDPLVRARLLLAAASLPADAQDSMREQLQVSMASSGPCMQDARSSGATNCIVGILALASSPMHEDSPSSLRACP